MSVPTYDSTLQFHGLSVTQMKDECCEEVLHELAKKMNRWRSIQLGVDKGVIEGIENDRSTDDEGKRSKLLERWKQKFGHEATYERIVRCLMKSERTDLADVVCEELKEVLALNIQREPQQARSYEGTLHGAPWALHRSNAGRMLAGSPQRAGEKDVALAKHRIGSRQNRRAENRI